MNHLNKPVNTIEAGASGRKMTKTDPMEEKIVKYPTFVEALIKACQDAGDEEELVAALMMAFPGWN